MYRTLIMDQRLYLLNPCTSNSPSGKTLLSAFYRRGNRSLERFRNLPQATQQVRRSRGLKLRLVPNLMHCPPPRPGDSPNLEYEEQMRPQISITSLLLGGGNLTGV